MNAIFFDRMGKKYFSEKEALEKIFEKIKPSIVGKSNYSKFASYRQRWRNGTLGDGAKNALFDFFGFVPTSFEYDKEKDKTKKED